MISINKTMCLGGLCPGFMFSDIFNTRILGPVDNVGAYNFKSLLYLFNDKLFDAILNDKIDKKEINEASMDIDDDNYFRYYCNNSNDEYVWAWRTTHNNFERNDRKETFKQRIKNFNSYIEESKLDKSMYFIYSITEHDYKLGENDLFDVLEKIPQHVIDKLLIISTHNRQIPQIFMERFICISYNLNLLDIDDEINKLWLGD